ncbi:hypothetical protein DQ04_05581070 [Trypanosoma grayi]|uniref:hypothetical protein n=1 Tax=Trypanosoma grayi TaxID=71804 RepID=UPI0004F49C5D|nr:hypothetical protein DQ04_05581070 [Trypanosoma grayi]KEG09227.1 hypothetical protein DQ04_05581070 [Trypanosoma grayi]
MPSPTLNMCSTGSHSTISARQDGDVKAEITSLRVQPVQSVHGCGVSASQSTEAPEADASAMWRRSSVAAVPVLFCVVSDVLLETSSVRYIPCDSGDAPAIVIVVVLPPPPMTASSGRKT